MILAFKFSGHTTFIYFLRGCTCTFTDYECRQWAILIAIDYGWSRLSAFAKFSTWFWTIMATNLTFHPGSVTSSERATFLQQKGITIWLTGLSASGKVSLSHLNFLLDVTIHVNDNAHKNLVYHCVCFGAAFASSQEVCLQIRRW